VRAPGKVIPQLKEHPLYAMPRLCVNQTGAKKVPNFLTNAAAPVIMNSHRNKNTQVSGAALRVAAGAAVFHLCNGAHYLLSVFKQKEKGDSEHFSGLVRWEKTINVE
jgi:hypothetical protein